MNEILLLADWEVFPFFGIITILLSGVSAYLAWKDKKSIAIAGMVLYRRNVDEPRTPTYEDTRGDPSLLLPLRYPFWSIGLHQMGLQMDI